MKSGFPGVFGYLVALILCCLSVVCIDSCSNSKNQVNYSVLNKRQKKIYNMKKDTTKVGLSLPEEHAADFMFPSEVNLPQSDTLKVKGLDGEDVFVMKTVKDEATGEMVVTEQLRAAVVTARFRNVAERHGEVDIQFKITVPHEMFDTRWQLRFYPEITMLDKTEILDQVIITGQDYRNAQLKGYQHYTKFLSTIISDSTKFIDLRNLEIWLSRNMPDLYKYKTDSTEVSDEIFKSSYGVTQEEALQHYYNQSAERVNDRRKSMKEKMFRKYIKSPIQTDNVALDTVLKNFNGDFEYIYNYTITARPRLRKADVSVHGEIFEQDLLLYEIPAGNPVTFYISTLSSFVDRSPRYLTKIVMRKAEANRTYKLDFDMGCSELDPLLDNNRSEIALIKDNLQDLVHNKTFDLDSIQITASASPEGSLKTNYSISLSRAENVSDYFSRFLQAYKDSVRKEEGVFMTIGEKTDVMAQHENLQDVKFSSAAVGEDWDALDVLVENDEKLNMDSKNSYFNLRKVSDPDVRENRMKKTSYYRYVSSVLYPQLRTVRFNFFLHRKGMVKDSVQTTEIDTTYMEGVKALEDRDFARAVELLRPYNCYNTALAYCAWDRNESAREILSNLPKTAQVLYMLAIIYSRNGDDRSAVECFIQSCQLEPLYKNRGNLDPEILALIKKYGLNKEE